MKSTILIVLSIAFFPVLAIGQVAATYHCSHGDLQRRVEILYETGGALPCEVHYYKNSNAPGESEVLWRAMNQSGYCEEKTESFIAKLQGLGWNCVGARHADDTDDEAAGARYADEDAGKAEAVDDTDALEPADDGSDGN